ncbi:MAG: ATP-dependent DNA helicase RecG [Nevskiaceae bacterium]|nr:MAG: ATP-dependent DNA helicase RecG [Nevskiaceae bacterium]TBR72109.1 MAG: ATP-dependent DNA helicase RecG [Nevskiaceae bacterium]
MLDDAKWLKGAGPLVARKLEILGIRRVVDVLLHLPLRYEDRRRVVPLLQLVPGMEALVVGRVLAADVRFAPRRSLRVVLTDPEDMARLGLRLFHFSEAQHRNFAPGRWVTAFGTVRGGVNGPEMIHPEYRVADDVEDMGVDRGWVPVYPTTAGLGQKQLRNLVTRALEAALADGGLTCPLPGFDGPTTLAALRALHCPEPAQEATSLLQASHPARQRLIEEELLAHQLAMRRSRAAVQARRAPVIPDVAGAAHRLQENLPFALTGAQRRAIGEIAQDLASGHPMMRLVQGDVGSGKTLVATAAMVACAAAGQQAVIMAPTELLAEQHAQNLQRWLAPLGLSVGRVTGHLPAARKREALAAAASGEIAIWVGTHALFQAHVTFARLALVVVDEQHRFGVGQRLALADKGAEEQWVHQLVMSATPIPRTLAQTLYADLDVSVIDELPPGRTPVTSVVLGDERRDEVVARLGHACADGRQAYWVCTLIEESEQLQAQTAEDTHAQLNAELPGLRIGLVHGRMKAADKERQMRAFAEGRTQVLVATTVIEVGVDVPNASIMVIDNAERLGLAQLHQLRGRVGRGAQASQCVLMYHPPLSQAARSRLEVLRETQDGFRIAERDLELRGPGELLGRRQTGVVAFRVADPARDAALVPLLQRRADDWLHNQPQATARLMARWVPDGARYGQV